MNTRAPLSALLVGIIVLVGVAGCAGEEAAVETPTTETPSAAEPAESEVPPLANEDAYRALISVGLERYDLTIDDGTFTVLQSMEGYGAAEWTKDDMRIIITHRDLDGDWEWTYTDEGVSVDSATPDAFTAEDKAEYLALAKRIVEAVGEDAAGITEVYTWKAAGGVMQGDYDFGPDKSLRLHVATDAEGRLGYSYMTNEM